MRHRRLLRRTPIFPLVLTGMVGLVVYYAAITRVWFAAPARRVLSVRFVTIPANAHEALAIWLHNSRLVVGVAVCATVSALVGRLPYGAKHAQCMPLLVADAILTVWAVSVALTAGVLLGAYGAVQARAFWPYAPVEVCGWALLLAAYLNARTARQRWPRTIRGLVAVEILLALAALLEVFPGQRL